MLFKYSEHGLYSANEYFPKYVMILLVKEQLAYLIKILTYKNYKAT